MTKPTILNSVSAVIINESNQVLIARTANTKTYNSGRWNVIPGNLSSGEIPESAVIEKVESKLGVTPQIIMGPIEWFLYQEERNVVFHDKTFLCFMSANASLKLNNKHIVETAWVDVRNQALPLESVTFLAHNLHMVGLTNTSSAYSILYTNYKGETETHIIQPIRYYFGHTHYHSTDQWLLEAVKVGKDDTRTYAVSDIHWFNPPVYLPKLNN